MTGSYRFALVLRYALRALSLACRKAAEPAQLTGRCRVSEREISERTVDSSARTGVDATRNELVGATSIQVENRGRGVPIRAWGGSLVSVGLCCVLFVIQGLPVRRFRCHLWELTTPAGGSCAT